MTNNSEKTSETELSPRQLAQKRGAETKRNKLSFKERNFVNEYIKNGGNGTEAVLKAYNTDSPNVSAVIASENLRKPKIKAEIVNLLAENSVELNEIVNIHARNMRQNKHLPTSQKAVTDFYEILGMKNTEKPSNEVKVAFVIEK